MRFIVLTLLLLSFNLQANETDFAQIEQDIRLIKMHYKPGADEKTLSNIDVLARSTAVKLIALTNNPANDETILQKSQMAWNQLELALGAMINDTKMLIMNDQLNLNTKLTKQIDLRVGTINGFYQRELMSAPAMGGSIVYTLIFSESGHISGIDIKDASSNMISLAKSIIPSLLTLRIPVTDAPTRIEWPLNFFPGLPP